MITAVLQVDLTPPTSDCLTRNSFGIGTDGTGVGAFRSFLPVAVSRPAAAPQTPISYITGRATPTPSDLS